jgi:predicted Zn-dependent protease
MRRFIVPLAGVAGLATLAACNDPGISQCFESNATAYPVHLYLPSNPSDTSVVFRWPDSFRPVRIYAEPVDSLQANAQRGMQLWTNGVRCGELSLQLWPDSTTADVVLRNPANLPAPPTSGLMLAADSTTACVGRTDVFLDSTLTFVVRPIRSYVSPNSIDTAAVNACYHFVTAHELGHSLGLFAHSSDPGDLMFARPSHTALSINDRYTIELLYHFDAPVKPSPR